MKTLLQIIVSVVCVIAARMLMMKFGIFPVFRVLSTAGIRYTPATLFTTLAAFSALFWFVVFYLRRPSKPMTEPYTIETQGDRATFRVNPQPSPAGYIPAILVFSACIGTILSLITSSNAMFPLYMAISFVVSYRIHRAVYDKKRRVTKEPFTIAPDGITFANGQSVPVDQIHQIVLKNGMNDEFVYFIGGGSFQTGANMIGASLLSKVTQRAYYIAIQHGGTETVLAGGMDQPQASGVFTEVTRRLGMS